MGDLERTTDSQSQSPSHERFREDVLAGLRASPRTLPCKYFYDRQGSELFERITLQPEYYLTRAESALLHAHAQAIAGALGPNVDLVELGSGSSTKTRILLDALEAPTRYVPVDVSVELLRATAQSLARAYPDMAVEPLVADYSKRVLGLDAVRGARRAVFFPGSSIGNFEPPEVVAFLERARALARPGGVVLVGVDIPKDASVLERAYDDGAGVTAAFNLNLLHRMKRELAAELDVSAFAHAAVWQPGPSRVEMRLVATRAAEIRVAGASFAFAPGAHVVTEHCYKHGVESFRSLARAAGLEPGPVWLDSEQRVSMHWLNVEEVRA